jgi:hypothetical protein
MRAANRPIKTVALLHSERGTFPHAVITGARSHAAHLDLDIVLDEPYPPLTEQAHDTPAGSPLPVRGRGAGGRGDQGAPWWDGEGLPSVVARLAQLQPDIILGVGTTEADLAFAQELRRQHIQAPVIALVAAPIEQFRTSLGDVADGICGPSQWEPSLQGQPDLGSTSAAFSSAFRARFGLEPDYPAAQAYAAGLIAARCAEIAGSLEDDALRQTAGTLDLTTFYGRFRLSSQTGQQTGHTMVVAQWQAGQKQIVWPPAVATAPPQLPEPAAAPTTTPLGGPPFS